MLGGFVAAFLYLFASISVNNNDSWKLARSENILLDDSRMSWLRLHLQGSKSDEGRTHDSWISQDESST